MSEIEKNFYGFDCVNLQAFPPEQPFSISGFTLFPYWTPGHTKGSVCFQIDDFLFTGDTLFVEGCGRCSDRESATEMFNSVQKLKMKIKPTLKVYPGHCFGIKPGVTFEFLLTRNIYCHLNDADTFVSFRMRKHQAGWFNFK